MKKKILALACLLLMGGLSVFFFAACDKDTNSYVEITVVDELTGRPIPRVFVKIDSNESDYGDTTTSSAVNATGFTDITGTFKAQFSAPAIFNVYAVYEADTMYNEQYDRVNFYCYRDGKGTIRLREGETVKNTIILMSKVNRGTRY
ncbi:MAG: hypothetical protein IJR26_05945 [Bacteroidales bacterium]|nr:hypothetical protein [Bacteroidales bacterium]